MMLEEINECPVCEEKKFRHFLTAKDHTITNEEFNIVECEDCGFLFTNPRPSQEAIGRYYQSEKYISHSNSNKGLINILYKIVRGFALKAKLRLINKENKTSKSLLDVGCGRGYFLKTCKKKGWEIEGVETDDNTRESASKILQQDLYKNIWEVPDGKKYGTITLWHVLEHVHQLNKVIVKLKSLLEENGTLIIAVPNPNSNDAKYFGKYWAAYDVPRHLYHFKKLHIEMLFEKYNMQVEKIKPMKYDAYYASLLSTKYKSGKTNFFNGFWRGFKSNQEAKSLNEYSSLIYIIKKR